jgi:hypothetical protein
VPSDESVGRGCLSALGSVGKLLLLCIVLPVSALIIAVILAQFA